MLDFTERLFSLLVSHYSYIAVRSYEEERVVRTIRALAEQLTRPVIEWSPTDDPEHGLLEVLRQLGDQPGGTITILADIHPYLDDPRIIRALRNAERVLEQSHQAVILVGPVVSVPVELLKDVTLLDAPLPGRIELEVALEEVFPPDKWPGVPRQRVIGGALGLTQREARRAFTRARFELHQARRRGAEDFDLEAAVVAEKRRLIEADHLLEYCHPDHQLSDVGGLDALKSWIEERRKAFTPEAAEFGLPVPKGLLLTGVQGCGKSLFARAVASFWGIPLLRMDISRLFDGSIPPEAALSRAIQTAEALSPAVLWLDEIDKAFGESSDGAVSRMMGSLLSWLQDKTRPVFFVATANRVETLPPELLRKGRFDEVFFVDLPSRDARVAILRIHLRRRARDPEGFELEALADLTRFFSGAELEQVVVSGLYKAFANERELEPVDLEVAIQETVPLYRTYENEIKALRAWAEGRARAASRDRTLIDLFNQPSPEVKS